MEVATEDIGACMETTQGASQDIQGNYNILNRWYRELLSRQPNPSRSDLENVSKDYATQYQREEPSPLGRPVPKHVNQFQIYNRVPAEASVFWLRLKRTGGHMHLWVKHFNMWLREEYPQKEASAPTPKPEKWMKLVELVQFMWDHGTIPAKMVWTILILIPKGNTDNQGIGILEVLWKVMEDIIDTRIKKAVESHDAPVRQTLQDVAEGRVPNEGGNSPLGT